jgi:hypothetical protein
MATEIEICNSAIAKIRGRRILTLDDDSTEARLCKDLYPRIRDRLLRAHPWNFAIERRQLGLLSAEPLYGYTAQFQLPSDCLRVLGTDLNDDEDWVQEGKKILCNRTELNVKLLVKVTDAEQYDAMFCEVLAYMLAAELAYPLTQGTSLAEAMEAKALKILQEARSFDAQEGGSTEVVGATSWLYSRF